MARTKKKTSEKDYDTYVHNKERLNNPPAGFGAYDVDGTDTEYSYDPHIDPQLIWSGKAERTSFEVPLVSLHIHENINPCDILKSAKKKGIKHEIQTTLFGEDSLLERKERLEFYRHKRGWENRLIAGDSLLVMNSLLKREGMTGKVQMIYVDPPYGITYGSNFQPFVNKKNVKDNRDEDLTQEPEMIKAFRDTWELGIHSYLSYLRDRLLLCRDLLSEEGSIFVQISDENLHYIRNICEEIFGRDNFVTIISYASTSGFATNTMSRAGDYVVWYAKNKSMMKFRPLFVPKEFGGDGGSAYNKIELSDGTRMSIAQYEKKTGIIFDYNSRPAGSKVYALGDITSQGAGQNKQPFEFEGKTYHPKDGNHWKANYPEGMNRLAELNRIDKTDKQLGYVRYFEDFPYMQLNNLWKDTLGQNQYGEGGKKYVVQTSLQVIQRCMLMSTDPSDLVLDITCGSGSTAYVAEKWGRRWITCDTSRISITLAKQRLMTASFDYYKLLHPVNGISGGLIYETVPHVTLRTLANNEPPVTEYFVDRPIVEKDKIRVSGPFTVEAIPAPIVHPLEEPEDTLAGASRQSEWRDELMATGVITHSGQRITFTRMEPLSGTTYLQAVGETIIQDEPIKVVVHFANESHPLDQRMVKLVLDESEKIRPAPGMILFCAFQFDPEAARFIDETKWPGVQLLKVQMNTDLMTDDLKKKRSSSQSFWMIGQPDVIYNRMDDGTYVVSIRGFDYYDVKTGSVESGDTKRISMWMLDTSYDGLTVNPSQIFFPMAGDKDGWTKLSKTLKAQLDPDLIELYRGVQSIPFKVDGPTNIAVKIIDDRGIESMKVLSLGGED